MKRTDVRRERYLLPKQLFVFLFADDDAGIFLDSRDVPPSSRSASDADDLLPGTSRCTPSDIVYRCLWACGSFRRCPLPSLPNWTLPYTTHLVAVIRRPAFQRWSPRTDAVTRRREPLSDVGSDRCLHPGDNRTVLPSLPQAALPRTLGTFLTCSSYRHFGSTPFQIRSVRAN